LIDALSPADKAALADLQETLEDEETGDISREANIKIQAEVLARALITDAESKARPFDTERGRYLLERAPFLQPLALKAMRFNGLAADQADADLDAAKNE
jgi:hypothetical protein